MTFARLLETGTGTIAARLEIEGLAIQPVSDPVMAQTLADGRRRVYCLNLEDAQLAIEEQVNIVAAELDGGAGSGGVTLFETAAEDLAQVFAWRPDVTRYVTSNGSLNPYLAQADTDFRLLSTAGLTAGDVVHIGTEAIKIGTVASSTSLTGCTRGYWGTIAQKHWARIPGRLSNILLTNRPIRIRGRRAKLYLYSDGDDLTGAGTRVWTGFVGREPACDEAGGLWRIGFEPLTRQFAGKVGGALENPVSARGIYYPWNAPLEVEFRELVSGTWNRYRGLFVGFYETQRAFIEALNTWLATAGTAKNEFGRLNSATKAAALPACTLRAEERGRGWDLRIAKDATVSDIWIEVGSPVDGGTEHESFLQSDGVTPSGGVTGTFHYYPVWVDEYDGVAVEDPRTVPRGSYGPERRVSPGLLSEDDASLYPADRVYIDGPVSDDWGSMMVEWPSTGEAFNHVVTARSTSVTNNYVILRDPLERRIRAVSPLRVFTGGTAPVMRPILTLATGDLADLRDALVTKGPEFANRGAAPFVTTEDLADWSSVVSQATRGRPWLGSRTWDIGKPVTLDELLIAEFNLLGVYPVTDSDGKIALALLDMPNASTVDATEIDEEIVSVGWSSMKRGDQTVNRYILRIGYDPLEDEWERTIDPEDAHSYSFDHEDRPMTVEPRSRSNLGDDRVSPNDAMEAALPYLGLFGYPYDLINVHVSWRLFSVLLGQNVSFSAAHLPDYTTGQRPISEVLGIVVGRRWEIGQAHGTLTLLLPWSNVSGYTPTLRITAQLNTSGNTWELGFNLSKYAPSGTTADQFLQAGDKIRIVEYDTESPTVITGTVDSNDPAAHDTVVTLDSAWTPGSSTWELMFRGYGAVQASQKRFAFIARSDGTLGGTDDAREFAP